MGYIHGQSNVNLQISTYIITYVTSIKIATFHLLRKGQNLIIRSYWLIACNAANHISTWIDDTCFMLPTT